MRKFSSAKLHAMITHPAVARMRAAEAAKYDSEYFRCHYWREDLPGLTGNRGLHYDDPDHLNRFDFLFHAIIEQSPPRSLLDAGCGQGHLLTRALDRGIRSAGIDISEAAKDFFDSSTGAKYPSDSFTLCSLTDIPFPDRSFDLVLCLDVLEHLTIFDIFAAVSELVRVARHRLICSINLDNPYYFHPSILSAESWIALFESTGAARYLLKETQFLRDKIAGRYEEYSMFVFDTSYVTIAENVDDGSE
jgi:2-polyprenyl-3-methyl-5-hydroxy-6-metoxy-1,4-benzoquinol methylase